MHATSRCGQRSAQQYPMTRIRDAAHIREGDMLAFDLDSNNRITIKRIDPTVDVELSALQETLSEWNSPQDEEAWRDL